MRIISFSDFHADAYPIYKELKILRLDFISLQNNIFVHDLLKKKLPKCFDSYFHTIEEVHSIGTKNAKLGCLFIPFVSTSKYGLNSITIQSILSWNTLCKALNCNLAAFSRSVAKKKNYYTLHTIISLVSALRFSTLSLIFWLDIYILFLGNSLLPLLPLLVQCSLHCIYTMSFYKKISSLIKLTLFNRWVPLGQFIWLGTLRTCDCWS